MEEKEMFPNEESLETFIKNINIAGILRSEHFRRRGSRCEDFEANILTLTKLMHLGKQYLKRNGIEMTFGDAQHITDIFLEHITGTEKTECPWDKFTTLLFWEVCIFDSEEGMQDEEKILQLAIKETTGNNGMPEFSSYCLMAEAKINAIKEAPQDTLDIKRTMAQKLDLLKKNFAVLLETFANIKDTMIFILNEIYAITAFLYEDPNTALEAPEDFKQRSAPFLEPLGPLLAACEQEIKSFITGLISMGRISLPYPQQADIISVIQDYWLSVRGRAKVLEIKRGQQST